MHLKKRITSIIISICIMLSAVPLVSAASYSDVQSDSWYYTYVTDLSSAGVVSGYLDGSFRPDNTVTCGEALKLVMRAAGYSEQASNGGHWAQGYLSAAISDGLVSDGDISDLDAGASRLLIASIAAKALKLSESSSATPFTDVDNGYATALYKAGIFEGSYAGDDLVFKSDDGIKRSEISAVIWRINKFDADSYVEKPDTPAEETPDTPAEENPGGNGSTNGNSSTTKKIYFGSYTIDVQEDVPVSEYNLSLFKKDSSTGRISYNSDEYYSILGLDVSQFQKTIDWAAVKNAGVKFVFIRLGGRGYVNPKLYLDTTFAENMKGALAQGLDVGVYFFSQAITTDEAKEEAEFVLQYLKGYDITYPVVFDWEVNSESYRTYDLDTKTLCECAKTFCDIIENAGYDSMVYTNLKTAYLRYDFSKVWQYGIWLAQYGSRPTLYYDFDFWQYTDSGTIDGISTKVDMNIQFIKK